MKTPFDGPRAAVLIPKSRALVAAPIFERGDLIQLKQERKRSGGGKPLRPGELVIVEPAGMAKSKRAGRAIVREVGQVVRRLGSADVTRNVIEALMIERGLARRFSAEVDRHARQAADAPDEFARRDLTTLPTFTMDPEGAKDYDDAISAERDGDDIRIWVHIADVSAFVRPGDPVDKEAYRRATSVYVPGAVEPMLPEALSNEACSLVPHEDRRAVTVEILFKGDEPVKAAFYRSTICSDARLTYGTVDEIFAGRAQAEDPWAKPLELARRVGHDLEQARQRRKALEVESREPVFQFDQQGVATDVQHEQQTESHKVIEHLMIAANEQVATYLEQHKLPALYRIHERPEPVKVEFLAAQLESLGVPTPPMPEHFTSQEAEQLVAEISGFVARHLHKQGHGYAALTSLVLRTLKQAAYSPKNLGHSGLRSTHYCHFTSPIRRYPDLIVHRALMAGLGEDSAAPRANDLPDAAEWTSLKEREAMSIERKADDIGRTFLLRQALTDSGWEPVDRRDDDEPSGPVFDGEVTGMVGGGLFVAFGPDLRFEGFVRRRDIKDLRGGFWNLNEFATAFVDEDTDHDIRLGQQVKVAVADVDPPRGRVDLLPVSL